MGKKKQLPKYVYEKGGGRHKSKSLYFEKLGWPSIKFQTQDSKHPNFYAEYAAILRGEFDKKPLEARTSDKRTFNKLIQSY